MRRLATIGLAALLAACAPTDDGGEVIGSYDPQPNHSGAPLRDDAVGPSEEQAPIESGP